MVIYPDETTCGSVSHLHPELEKGVQCSFLTHGCKGENRGKTTSKGNIEEDIEYTLFIIVHYT